MKVLLNCIGVNEHSLNYRKAAQLQYDVFFLIKNKYHSNNSKWLVITQTPLHWMLLVSPSYGLMWCRKDHCQEKYCTLRNLIFTLLLQLCTYSDYHNESSISDPGCMRMAPTSRLTHTNPSGRSSTAPTRTQSPSELPNPSSSSPSCIYSRQNRVTVQSNLPGDLH
jgi:hypothetical protein